MADTRDSAVMARSVLAATSHFNWAAAASSSDLDGHILHGHQTTVSGNAGAKRQGHLLLHSDAHGRLV